MVNFRRYIIYLAGPYRTGKSGGVMANIRAAERVAYELWKIGFSVICPHMNTAWFSEADGPYPPLPAEHFLEGDLTILERCDAILMLDGWDRSQGAIQERAHAWIVGVPDFYNMENLVPYFTKKEKESANV